MGESALTELQGAATSALRVVATLQRVGLSSLQRAQSKMASPMARRSPPRRRKGGVRGSPLRGRSKAPSRKASPRNAESKGGGAVASPRAPPLTGTAPTPE